MHVCLGFVLLVSVSDVRSHSIIVFYVLLVLQPVRGQSALGWFINNKELCERHIVLETEIQTFSSKAAVSGLQSQWIIIVYTDMTPIAAFCFHYRHDHV